MSGSATTGVSAAGAPESARPGVRGPRLGRMVLGLEYGPPVAAFVGATIVLFVAARCAGVDAFSALSWYRGDSLAYGDIAQGGYTAASAGWFPGYPGVVAVLVDLQLPLAAGAVAVSWGFDLLALGLLWNAFLRDRASAESWLALIFAACGPGGIFLRAAFPLSITTCFILLWLLALRDGHWRWAGIAGGCAAVCFPTAVILVPLSVVWALIGVGRPTLARLVDGLQCAVLALLGWVIALGIIAVQTHKLTAFFSYQSSLHHHLREPFANLWPLIEQLGNLSQTQLVRIESAEALLAAVVVVGLGLGLVGRAVRGGGVTRWDLFLWLFVLVAWLVPGAQANQSWWRDDALLLAPAALLLGRVRGEAALLIGFASLTAFPFLAYAFFTGELG